MAVIDEARCLRAMEKLAVGGNPCSEQAKKAIGELIEEIRERGKYALKKELLTIVKNDLFLHRLDLEYGHKPKLGQVVFFIRRTDPRADGTLGADEIYFLEQLRDFGMYVLIKGDAKDPKAPKIGMNLAELLARRTMLMGEVAALNEILMQHNNKDHVQESTEVN